VGFDDVGLGVTGAGGVTGFAGAGITERRPVKMFIWLGMMFPQFEQAGNGFPCVAVLVLGASLFVPMVVRGDKTTDGLAIPRAAA
jgi:hypothetical protein